jgi:raffinose/stachyose/melibiose transport system substrate-binding protein
VALADQWNPEVNCAPLTDQEWVSRMDKSVLPSISVNNKVYGITFGGYKVWWYYYNKDLFAKLGLSAPTNYDEFKNVCQKIKDSGVIPIYEAIQDGWHQQLPFYELGGYYNQKNPGLYDKLNKNEIKIKDIPEALEVLKELKEFQKLGFFGEDYMSNSIAGDFQAIAEGKYAMTLEGFGWEQSLIKSYPDMKGKIGIFTMPYADAQCIGTAAASNAYFINSRSENIEECKAFFNYLAQTEVLQERLDGDPEAIALCWPEIKPEYPAEYTQYLDSISHGICMQTAVKYTGDQWMDTGKDIASMYTGDLTPEEVLQNISDRRDEQAKLQKDPNWK